VDQQQTDYMKYRGKCKELSEAAIESDSTLRLVRGYYYCPIWNSQEPHWWTASPDGKIHDPTKDQFPSKGGGMYEEFDGKIECSECGKEMNEDEADIEGNYAFCSYTCHGRFVGVL
jgi:hypothetical protein